MTASLEVEERDSNPGLPESEGGQPLSIPGCLVLACFRFALRCDTRAWAPPRHGAPQGEGQVHGGEAELVLLKSQR